MADEQNPKTEGNTPEPQQPTGGKAASVDVSALTRRVEELSQKLSSTEGKLKETQAERDSFQTSVQQLTEKNSGLSTDLEAALGQVKQLNGQVATFQTQVEQLNGQLTDVNQNYNGTQQELNMFKMIAENPDYHGLIGLVNSLKVGKDAEEQQKILDDAAKAWQAGSQQLVQMIQGGATPPSGAGNKQRPAEQGPTDIKGIHARLNQIVGMPGHDAEIQQLQGRLIQLQYGNGNTQPA